MKTLGNYFLAGLISYWYFTSGVGAIVGGVVGSLNGSWLLFWIISVPIFIVLNLITGYGVLEPGDNTMNHHSFSNPYQMGTTEYYRYENERDEHFRNRGL